MVNFNGKMEQDILVNSNQIVDTEKAELYIMMGVSMMESG